MVLFMSPAPHLGLPLDPPQPVPGCRECADLARQRAEAQAAKDYSRATDCNVRLRRHAWHGCT
ncbi:hypothetical protein [Streptomyces thermodiastaticus]|uniref:hypothetical protein n=1 Tax=Streptomyces thermodiastaticus TaxID=44061 RepID=UPI00167706B8|nr:hypothetical protein [Streptomyces thermodiastaticus]MBX6386566.1 hypothetical protein [Microbispora sp.]MCE7550919.1 hypothetical protein [Streptomyces thermodiastaticus]GHF73825.1 hypothetical protein GCM10018787_23130 [Streptomyces thermodiastaticus]